MIARVRPFSSSLLAGLCCSSALAQSPAAPPVPASAPVAKAVQADFVAIAKNVFPSLVTVRTYVRIPAAEAAVAAPAATAATAAATTSTSGWTVATTDDREYPGFRQHGSSSGFFVGQDGDVMTVLQPLRVRDDVLVDLVDIETADGQRVIAEVLGIEPTLQLAVLRGAVFQSHTKPAMTALRLADSDATEVGQWLLGFGDPSGPDRFLGFGLLSAKPARDCYQELMSATYMQATMMVPAGAFGGPMVDLDGNVVGILCPLDGSGVGSAWALPSKILQGLHESIRAAGTTQSPWLGWSVMSRAEIATTRGLKAFQAMVKPRHGILIENVFAPSPAHAAGVLPGDFLTHWNGLEIHAPVDFQRQLYLAGVGATVTVTMVRGTETMTKELRIEKRPAAAVPR